MQKRIFFCSFLLLLSIAAILYVYCQKSNSSIVYVDSNKLFTDFKMTKELKIAGEKELKFKNSQLDSLKFLLNVAHDENSKSALMQRFVSQKQSIDEFQRDYIQSNSEKIWSRISTYSKDFAESKGYDIIIGSNGKEQLLYGKKEKDITVLLLNFINKKYEGFQ